MSVTKRNRSTKLELERRVIAVQKWIVEGVQSAVIIQTAIREGWCTSTRQAERLLAEGRKRWALGESNSVDEKRMLKIQELKQLRRSLKKEFLGTPAGIRAQLAIDKEIIKLEGTIPRHKEEPGDGATDVIITIKRANRNPTAAGQPTPAPAKNEG